MVALERLMLIKPKDIFEFSAITKSLPVFLEENKDLDLCIIDGLHWLNYNPFRNPEDKIYLKIIRSKVFNSESEEK